MKKLLSILLVLAAISPLTVFATQGETSQDAAENSVHESQKKESKKENDIKSGTDFYLFVDSESAGCVTFWVTDSQNQPIEDVKLRLQSEGAEEFTGSTNQEGLMKIYLARDQDYRYVAEKESYNTTIQDFTVTEEEQLIHIVLYRPGEKSPQTGDVADVTLLVTVCVLSMVGMALILLKSRKLINL